MTFRFNLAPLAIAFMIAVALDIALQILAVSTPLILSIPLMFYVFYPMQKMSKLKRKKYDLANEILAKYSYENIEHFRKAIRSRTIVSILFILSVVVFLMYPNVDKIIRYNRGMSMDAFISYATTSFFVVLFVHIVVFLLINKQRIIVKKIKNKKLKFFDKITIGGVGSEIPKIDTNKA